MRFVATKIKYNSVRDVRASFKSETEKSGPTLINISMFTTEYTFTAIFHTTTTPFVLYHTIYYH